MKKIIKHPYYKKGHLDNDIALLIVWEKFNFKGAAKPIKLPVQEPQENREVVVTGWSQQDPVNIKKRIFLRIICALNFHYTNERFKTKFFRTPSEFLNTAFR